MRLILLLGLLAVICLAVATAAPQPNKKNIQPVLIKKIQPVKKGLLKSIKRREADPDPEANGKRKHVVIKKVPVKSIKKREADPEASDMKHKKPLPPLRHPIRKELPKTPKLRPLHTSKAPIQKKKVQIKKVPMKSIKKREADAEASDMKHKKPLPPLRHPIRKGLPKKPSLQPLKVSKAPIKKKKVVIKPMPKKMIKKREADPSHMKKKEKPLPPLRKPIKKDLPKTPPLKPLKVSKAPIKKKKVQIKKVKMPKKHIKH